MNEQIETVICWAALLIGAVLCLGVSWLLMRQVSRGKANRFVAVIAQGVACPFLGMAPMFVALVARWLASLSGVVIFSRDGGNDGMLVGLGIMGTLVAVAVAALFTVVMLVQAATRWGASDS